MPKPKLLFSSVAAQDKLHKNFKYIASSPNHIASRRVLQQIFESLPKPDGNFVLDFQTTGFDARIWELYLAALFNSLGFSLTQPADRPDFLLSCDGTTIWVEATTANPTQDASLGPSIQSAPAGSDSPFWDEFEKVTIKLGSALWSKLRKEYWKLSHVAGHPLVFAIQDFHDPNPLRSSFHALERYLYGFHFELTSRPGDYVDYELHGLEVHRSGSKEIPAGFFNQPDSEHVSAVLFSNAATITKFNRMELQKGGYETVRAMRSGIRYDSNPTAMIAAPFAYIAGDRIETWGEEAILFHNPNAKFPIALGLFPEIAEVAVIDGEFLHTVPSFHPMMSITQVAVGTPKNIANAERALRIRGAEFVERYRQDVPELMRTVTEIHSRWSSK